MKMISWNVNGIRACVNKGFGDFFDDIDADLFAVQETKAQDDQIPFHPEGYFGYFNAAGRKGYSGVAVYAKKEPLSVTYGMGVEEHDHEGRLITLEYDNFYFVCCYTPNSKKGLTRLDDRCAWEKELLQYLDKLDAQKPIVYCGDLNVAHEEIDLKNPQSNHKNAGFSDEERACMTELLSHGYVDSFRHFYPDKTGAYSWWSYRFKAREKDAGWRIDYFIVSDRIKDKMKDAYIYKDVMGSDHCPVGLEVDL